MGLDAGIATLISSVVSLAGLGAGIAANQEETSAMNTTVGNEVQQLQALQKQATPTYEENLAKSTPKAAQADVNQSAQQALGEYVRAAQSPTLSEGQTSLPQGKSSNVTQAGTQLQLAQGQKANAANQGYQGLGTAWSVQDQGVRDLLGNIVAQGSSIQSSLPAQLAVAKNSQATLAGVGSMLQTAGLLGNVAAATAAPTGSDPALAPGGAWDQQSNLDPFGAQYQYQTPSIDNPYTQPSLQGQPFPMYNWS